MDTDAHRSQKLERGRCADTPAGRRGPARPAVLLALMCVGMFLVQLDVTVVNVALPAIRAELDVGLSGQQWVVDSYAIVLASLLLTGGTVGDRYGHKRVVLAGLGLFALASTLCGLAPTIGVLITGRAVQGVGAALLLPGTLAVITHAFPGRAEQARAIGIWAGVSALALPAGPLIGGGLVSGLGWHAVFLINLPVVAVAGPAAARLVPDTTAEHPRRLDLPGAGWAALALATSVYAVISAGQHQPAATIVAAAVLAIAAGVGFVVRERHARDPLLPITLLRSRAFVGANTVAAAMNVVGIGSVFVATLYLQTVQHRPAFTAGALLIPLFAPLAALAPVTGRLTARFGSRPPMSAGLLCGALGSALLYGLTPTSSYARLLPVLLCLGIGQGLLTAAVVAAAIRSVPAERAGLASGVNNTARQAAGALGIAGYGAVTGTPTQPVAFTTGLHTVGLTAAALWLAAAALTWLTIGKPQQQRARDQRVNGITPLPATASASRCDSPVVEIRCARPRCVAEPRHVRGPIARLAAPSTPRADPRSRHRPDRPSVRVAKVVAKARRSVAVRDGSSRSMSARARAASPPARRRSCGSRRQTTIAKRWMASWCRWGAPNATDVSQAWAHRA